MLFSAWISDVCSSDLPGNFRLQIAAPRRGRRFLTRVLRSQRGSAGAYNAQGKRYEANHCKPLHHARPPFLDGPGRRPRECTEGDERGDCPALATFKTVMLGLDPSIQSDRSVACSGPPARGPRVPARTLALPPPPPPPPRGPVPPPRGGAPRG